jgi:lysozyme
VVAAFAGCSLVLVGLAWLFRGRGETDLEPPECRQGPTVPGIDVSYYQETIHWHEVRRTGVVYAFIRVSDGSTLPDTMFRKNWAEAKRAGVMRGAYQYFRPDQSAAAQADLVIAALERDRGELPPVIDVETDGGRSPTQIAQRVAIWVTRVRAALGVEPIIYTGPEFWRDKVGGADLTTQPLWLAHYTAQCPTVPAPWTTWTFWQYSDRGSVPGITGAVDLDVFAGTVSDLKDFARRSRRTP